MTTIAAILVKLIRIMFKRPKTSAPLFQLHM